ncbi:MAG TPA: MFS transporter [Stellaceae bacterium]|nr:MFS transporter [Stellaceae bacterium]
MPARQMLRRLALLWLSGAALRLAILAVPPVIPLIRSDLDLSATALGLLSGLPVLLFAVAALPGSILIARLGGRMTLVGGLFLAAMGAALRGIGAGAGTLYAATAVMGAGVAIMQPSMPVLTREWLPSRIGFATAVYSNGLLVGEILPVWLAVPVVMPLLGGSWRFELAIWSLPVLLIGVLVLLLGPAAGDPPRGSNLQAWWPDWRNPLIWRLGILFGSVNAVYFSTNAFLPAYLSNTGRGDLIGAALTALNLGQLPTSLAILPIATRLERRAWPYVVAGTTMTAAVIGIVALTGVWLVVCAALLGCAGAASLILGLTLPPLLSEPGQVGRTSAAMFSISYAAAMIVALLCGAVWDVTGLPGSAFAPIGLCTLVLSFSALGLRAAKQLR